MARRRTRSWSEIIPTLIILLVFMLVGIFAGIRNALQEKARHEEAARQESLAAEQRELEEQAAAAYNDAMSVLGTKGYKCKNAADKAVSLMADPENDGQTVYTKEYIPEAYIAGSPEEVRYIVHFVYEDILFGKYLGGGNGYQRSYHVQVEDLNSGDIIAEEIFLGRQPPGSVKAGSGDHYGTYPDCDAISDWIDSVISAS